MYVREWQARFSHVDMFRFVFYPELARVVHDTSDEFLDRLGFSYAALQDDHGVGLPLVEMGAEFERPIRVGDVLEIRLTHEAGTSSLRFDYEATNEAGEVAFSAHEQRVCVPVGEDRSTPLPDEFRAALEEAAGSTMGDGTGA